MGCDIHVTAEVRRDGVWTAVTEPAFSGDWFDVKHGRPLVVEPFGWRNYAMFELFADVRARGDATPISKPRGTPEDVSDDIGSDGGWPDDNYHSHSWLSAAELDIDYDQMTPNGDPLRDNLGDIYFEHLDQLRQLGAPDDVRIVFCFDN